MKDAGPLATPRLVAAGDQSLVVELGRGIDENVNRRVHALDLALRERSVPGVVDLIPTYRSLLVNYDPLRIDLRSLMSAILEIAAGLDDSAMPAARRIDIPTCYGAEFGPDLPHVAQHNHLSEQEVVALHTGGVCRVYMMGFSPGFSYLGGMSDRIATPRLRTPRTAIPAGSVGIAQQQTGIYPVESPGGWQLIGRTPLRLFDPDRNPPTLLEPGDEVRFVAIDEAQYRELEMRERRKAEGGRRNEEAPPAACHLPPVIEVLDAGGLTTVQDLGRYGFQRYGVPVSGAMDAFALRVANLLAGNEENAAALEITVTGPQIVFLRDAVIAIAGGDLQPRVDDRAAPMWEAFAVAGDSVLTFRGPRMGARAYLAVAGGLDVPIVLASRSTYLRSRLGGCEGRTLQPGDRLVRGPAGDLVEVRRMPASWLPTYLGSHRLRVVPGPQDAAFTRRGIQTFLSSAYKISSASDRMGYRMEGPAVEHAGSADIVSDGTPAGAVQVAADGMPLVLLADRGTTGGYAKIATVIAVDLPRLAQSRPGDRVFFDAVTVEEAHAALRRQEDLIEQIRNAPTEQIASHSKGGRALMERRRTPRNVGIVTAPFPGRIVDLPVAAGDSVKRGQKLCVLEAMKMQNPICATAAGRVKAVKIAAGEQVNHGQVLFEIASSE